MSRTINIKKNSIIVAIISWWSLFILLSFFNFNHFQLLNVIGFTALIFIPGVLTIIILDIKKNQFWGTLGLIVGFSILEIMSVALIGNAILPYLGIGYPLEKSLIIFELSLLVSSLLFLAWRSAQDFSFEVYQYILFKDLRDFLYAVFPIVFVVMSVFGAIRLNNGGDGVITFAMLLGMATYFIFLIVSIKKIGANVIPTALFFISVSLLFMTSLRGWHITGHDIQSEYFVFQLTKNTGAWVVANYRDAYNACLSITILPTIFSNLLKFYDPYVYKVFFQIIFAFVPPILYLSIKRYTSSFIAFLSTIYFVSFPTFFIDLPMLNRQEIAFLYLSLMVFVIFNNKIQLKFRQVIFLVFGVGMIFSHYSTTYTVLASLFFLIIAQFIVVWIGNKFSKSERVLNSGFSFLSPTGIKKRPRITITMVAVLMVSTFIWTNVLTGTAENSISRVFTKTIEALRQDRPGSSKSVDVFYSLFSWKKPDSNVLMQSYIDDVVVPTRKKDPSDYYNGIEKKNYGVALIVKENNPLTKFGKFLSSKGLDVAGFNYYLRQGSAKMLQLLIMIGFIAIFFTARFVKKPIDTEFALLAIAGLVLIASQIALPVLSVEYGVLRAFQQSLIFLSPFIVIGSMALVFKFGEKVQYFVASFFVVLFFLSITGVFTQIFGGYDSELHLSNNGKYYDVYYLRKSEISAIQWLGSRVKGVINPAHRAEAQSDWYTAPRVKTIAGFVPVNDIFPGLVRKDNYVYLGYNNINNRQAPTSYKSSFVNYSYPLDFLNSNKDLIYDNGDSRVYK